MPKRSDKPPFAPPSAINSHAADPLAAAVFDSDDSTEGKLEIPEWGVTLSLKSISAKMRGRFVREFQGLPNGAVEPLVYLLINAAYNPETGERVFDDSVVTREKLGEKSPAVLDRIATEILTLSGMKVKSRELAEKNSESPQKDDSSTH